MIFNGFTSTDFATFTVDGLEARMKVIQERIQPKFKLLGNALCSEVSLLTGSEMHLHIARHLRRKTNAPVDTWLAICHSKRGYKMHPHFQVGLFDDHVFIWLALIYELPDKVMIAENYLKHLNKVKKLIPKDYVLSQDHMKKTAVTVSDLNKDQFCQVLTRFRDVKQAELLMGRKVMATDPLLENGDEFIAFVKSTIETLTPLYCMARQA